jgi:thiol-disulfide isomerase/thioredoxin
MAQPAFRIVAALIAIAANAAVGQDVQPAPVAPGVFFFAAAGPEAQAPMAGLDGKVVQFIHVDTGKVLGVEGDSLEQIASAVLADADPKNKSRLWHVAADGEFIGLVNGGSGLLLDIQLDSKDEGANVIQWPAKEARLNTSNQRWAFDGDVGRAGRITSKLTSMALDVAGAGESRVTQKLANPNSRSQLWRIQIVDVADAIAPKQGDHAGPRLQMANGDFYTGRLMDSDEAGIICWQSDAAVGPYQFDLSAVSAAHFQREGGSTRPVGDFCVELVGGDAVFGSLVSMTADEVELDTKTFGRLHLERAHVQRMQAWGETSGVEYLGPDGLHGWTAREPDSSWVEEAGHPIAHKPGAIVINSIEIPPQASIEVELSWQQKANFSLQFGSEENLDQFRKKVVEAVQLRNGERAAATARVEDKAPTAFELAVWGDSVVLVREQADDADLAPLEQLTHGPGRLSLRIQYDQEAGVVAAYSLEGKFLASVKTGGSGAKAPRGVQLVNKDGDICLERLMVSRWGGAPPPEIAANRPYIQVRDGSVVEAEGASFDGLNKEFVVAGKSGERRIPSADVACFVMPKVDAPPEMSLRLSLHDGARINGDLIKVENGILVISRRGISQPLQVPADLVQSLVVLRPGSKWTKQNGRMGRLETAGGSSHGMLVDAQATADASCLAWLPSGSSISRPLRLDASGRIVFRTPPPPIVPQPVEARRRAPVAGAPGLWNNLLQAYQRKAPQEAARERAGGYTELLWLRAGDRIPCLVTSIDERGVTFKTPLLQATFVPHDSVKAWDCVAGSQPRALDESKQARLLTLPRMQRENPPTQLIESVAGDFLRGRLESMDEEFVHVEVRLESKQMPRRNIARIIWLTEKPAKEADGAGQKSPEAAANGAAVDAPPPAKLRVQAVCSDGVRLTFEPERFADGVLSGASPLLGPCSVPVSDVDQFYLGGALAGAAEAANYSAWRLHAAADPRFVAEDGQPAPDGGIAGRESALVGQAAPDFELELAAGGKFRLSGEKGRVVVLDFWASWCGWCMQSMPELDEMSREFGDKISWVAVNLQEDRKTIAGALERLGVSPRVALDIDGATGEKFGVTGIPQTVVIDAEGKVTRVFVGGGPNAVEQIRAAITEAVAGKVEDANAPVDEPGDK